jgi:2-hydroxychromene-2-carboxylate isomerase
MADRQELEFWYEFASTYSYPAAMRIAALANRAGVAVRWRPFLLAPIFGAQGWTDSPFNIYPTKGRYMWRDLERICNAESLPLTLPPVRFPQNGLKAARLALVGETAGWIADFSRAVYTANFVEQKDISDDAVLAAILAKLGINGRAAHAAANAAENKEKLKDQTNEAMTRGLFGAPSFTVGDELFWGNDRLQEAINWAMDVPRLVERELQSIEPTLAEKIRRYLIAPRIVMRFWDYAPVNDPKVYASWVVLEDSKSDVGIAYCPHGHGPKNPWGLVHLSVQPGQHYHYFGQDSAWFPSLARAFEDLGVESDS